MAHYRKKPVVIEAIQWDATADTWKRIMEMGCPWDSGPMGGDHFFIRTPEGNMKCNKGDYVIKGIKGEFYPCKPDIFEATYEIVSSEETNADETTTEGDTSLDDGGNGGNHPPGGPGKP